MSHKKVFGFCENHCKIEVPSKETFDEEKEKKQNKVLYGASAPANTLGVDGDIYIQIESD